MRNITRRQFLKLMAGTAGALVVAGGLGGVTWKIIQAGQIPAPWHAGAVSLVPSTCHMCLWKCGIQVAVADGRVHKIYGHPANPASRGKMCARGQAGGMDLYDPDRLKHPLIRVGERGEGKYRKVTWEEALDYAAAGLLAVRDNWDGPEAVAWFAHNGGDKWFAHHLPGAFGSPNAGKPSEAVCITPRERASHITFGRPTGVHEPMDWDETEYVVLIGNHIGENAHVSHMTGLMNARARGAKLVVVDPRMSTAAAKADLWLPIRPGTDTALLLAWSHVLITEEIYDRAYVAKWTVGFDELAHHVQPYTPEWAGKITDIPAETIRRVARELAFHAPRAMVPPGRHTTWYGNDTQRMRALYILNALLGAVGRPGGLYIGEPPFMEKHPHPPLPLEPQVGG